jgi:hypothetical protein
MKNDHLKSNLDILHISDFENHTLLQSYLDDYGVKIVNSGDSYTMVWEHGFMGMICPTHWHFKYAEIWSFYFVWHWLRGMEVWDAEELASKMMCKRRKKDKEYSRKMFDKRQTERIM